MMTVAVVIVVGGAFLGGIFNVGSHDGLAYSFQ